MGFFDKIKQGLTKTKTKMDAQLTGIFAAYEPGDEEFFEDLEETLILADTGVETTTKAIAQLRKAIELKKLRTGAEVKKEFVQILTRILKVQDTMLLLTTQPSVVLVVGVNGVGKTTTIGKLAAQLKKEGNRVLLSAADTFRAAAADQLTVWAQRAGVDIVKHEEGSDPAAVVFDAVKSARAQDADLLIVGFGSTFGHLRAAMNELRAAGKKVAHAQFKYINPLPANTAEVLKKYPKVVVAEQNMGQLAAFLRMKVNGFVPEQYNQVKGEPLGGYGMKKRVAELILLLRTAMYPSVYYDGVRRERTGCSI